MKTSTLLLGSLLISIAIPFGRVLASGLPTHVQSCLRQGANQRSGRYGGVSKIDVFSMFKAGGQTYLQARVTPASGSENGWSIVVNFDETKCEFIGDDYVAEIGLYGDMPIDVVRDWTIQLIQPRLAEVGKEQVSAEIKASDFQWHRGQIAAFEELGI